MRPYLERHAVVMLTEAGLQTLRNTNLRIVVKTGLYTERGGEEDVLKPSCLTVTSCDQALLGNKEVSRLPGDFSGTNQPPQMRCGWTSF